MALYLYIFMCSIAATLPPFTYAETVNYPKLSIILSKTTIPYISPYAEIQHETLRTIHPLPHNTHLNPPTSNPQPFVSTHTPIPYPPSNAPQYIHSLDLATPVSLPPISPPPNQALKPAHTQPSSASKLQTSLSLYKIRDAPLGLRLSDRAFINVKKSKPYLFAAPLLF